MPAPIRWKSKVILFKIEVTEGTDPVPTSGANAILATSVELTPMDGEDVSRNLELPYLGAQEMIPTGLRQTLKFNVELVPSGTAGTAPAWGPLLRACGVAETIVADTSVTYNPITANQESVASYFFIGATRFVALGSRGDVSMAYTAQGIPYLQFAFTGLYTAPAEHAPTTPTLTNFKKPTIATKANTPTFTVDGVALVMRDLTLALNNQIEPRLLVGREQILIVDRAESLKATVEAVPLTTYDPFARAKSAADGDADLVDVELIHGTVDGYITTLSLPTCQQKRPTGLSNNQNTVEWPLEFVPLPSAGNDQWTLELT